MSETQDKLFTFRMHPRLWEAFFKKCPKLGERTYFLRRCIGLLVQQDEPGMELGDRLANFIKNFRRDRT